MATWYVRSGTSHNSTRDGTSYATAWGGVAEIVWASVGASDTMYMCGTFDFAATWQPTKTGSSPTAPFVLRGDYQSDPGVLRFAGANYLVLSNNNQVVMGFDIQGGTVTAVLINVAKSYISVKNNVIHGGKDGIQFSAAAGSITDILIDGNEIYGIDCGGDGSAGAIAWYSATAVSSLGRITISNNKIHNITNCANVIHMRSALAGLGSTISDLTISGNAIYDCVGAAMRICHGENAIVGGRITVTRNDVRRCAVGVGNNGGLGFTGFNWCEYSQNYIENVDGPYGGGNIIFCNNVIVKDNHIGAGTTATIDGNGVLVDHLCNDVLVTGNFIQGRVGNASANSGCGVMILDATNVRVYGNVIDGCKHGLFFGAAAPGQQALIRNNTISNCLVDAIYLVATADRSKLTVQDNIFSGSPMYVNDTGSGWTLEDYNCVYNCGSSQNHTPGAHNLAVDPTLNADHAPTEQTLVGAGQPVPLGFTDFNGNAFKALTPTIGAIEVCTNPLAE